LGLSGKIFAFLEGEGRFRFRFMFYLFPLLNLSKNVLSNTIVISPCNLEDENMAEKKMEI
jgi:hypothetical protein